MSQHLRYRTIMGLSGAIGAEGPAAPPVPHDPAAGRPFVDVGGPVRVGLITTRICVAVAEKAIARLKTRSMRLSAELDELRNDGTALDREIDRRVRELAEVRTELELFQEQLADLRVKVGEGE